MKKRISLLLAGFCLLSFGCAKAETAGQKPGGGAVPPAEIGITLKAVSEQTISEKLLGYNIVYAKNPDKIWESGSLVEAIKRTTPAFLRYPGGTVVTFWHWNNPTGEGWKDAWDPAWSDSQKLSPTQYMDLDEYIALIGKTGAEPLMGVNVNSGFRWNRIEEGVEEALALMKYCKERGLKVKYWYLGNEPYMHDCNGGANTVAQYAEMVNTFAPRMRAFDPGIKLIVNWHATFRKHAEQYEELFRLAGKNFDIVDVHWYNMWDTATWEDWFKHTPVGVFTGDSYYDEIIRFREMAKQYGYPATQLASLEWNVGPGKSAAGPRLTADQTALVQSEMMMQFMLGGLDMATFWPLFWDSEFGFRSFFDKLTGQPQPISRILTAFGKLQGGKLVTCDVTPAQDKMIVMAARDKQQNLVLCVLNKNGFAANVSLVNKIGKTGDEIRTESFSIDAKDPQGSKLLDVETTGRADKPLTVKPYSITFVTFK